MEKEKEQWMDEVFGSMKGANRAKPRPDLFAKIELGIDDPGAKVISLQQLRYAAAVAVVLLLLNTFAFQQINQNVNENTSVSNNELPTSAGLISNYKIYE